MRNIHRMSLLAAALLASAGASAYEAGDWIVRGGAVMVAPNDDSSNLDLAGEQLAGTGVEVGSVKHLPPTLTVLWYPMESGAAFQPFIGAGINYTIFFQEDTSGAAQAALGARNLELDDSWGLAARAGFDYMLSDCWSLHAGVYYLGIDTKANLDTALGKVGVDVDINPWVYTVGLGYRF